MSEKPKEELTSEQQAKFEEIKERSRPPEKVIKLSTAWAKGKARAEEARRTVATLLDPSKHTYQERSAREDKEIRAAEKGEEEQKARAPEPEGEPAGCDPLWRAKSALDYLKPDDDVVRLVGLALHSTGLNEKALALWLGWLKRRRDWDDEKDRRAAQNAWSSFDTINYKVPVETLYDLAKKAGWRWPIIFNANKPEQMAQLAEWEMIGRGAEIYRHGAKIVRPVKIEEESSPNPDGKPRKTKVFKLEPMSNPSMIGELGNYIDWRRWDERHGRAVATAPNKLVAGIMLHRHDRSLFRNVVGIITCQTMRPDGSLLIRGGWDPQTKLLLVNPPPMKPIPVRPTKDDATAALEVIKGLLAEFPFVDEASRAVVLSAFLSVIARAALGCVPLHGFKAPAAGTGKSLLADLISSAGMGVPCPIMSPGADEEEMEKRLVQHLRYGGRLLSMDNVRPGIEIGGSALCQFVERPVVEPRLLGTMEGLRLTNNWVLLATGNNLLIFDDMTRRTVMCSMDAEMEKPWERDFKEKPVLSVLADRGKYIAAALTIIRAYHEAGYPERLQWIGDSFGLWSDRVRSALVWLGCDDPVNTMETVEEDDPKRQERSQVFAAIKRVVGLNEWFLTKSLIKATHMNINSKVPEGAREELKAALMTVASVGRDINQRRLGKWFGAARRVIVDGMRLEAQHNASEGVNEWRLVEVRS